MSPELDKLLGKIGRRLSVAGFARCGYISLLCCAAVYGLALIVSRLLGLAPHLFTPVTLLLIPVVAALIALCIRPRISRTECARALDRSQGTHDLFLTAVLLEPTDPAFAPLVSAGAETRCADIDTSQVVPWGGGQQALRALGYLSLVLIVLTWLPQLDPFGHTAAQQRQQARKTELTETQRATQVRKAQLTKASPRKKSEEVELRVEELKRTFISMKPGAPKENVKSLTQQQQKLGKSWQRAKASSSRLGILPGMDQAFGSESPNAETWRKEMASGTTASLQRETRKLQELSKKIAETTNGEERRKLERELKRRLQELAKFSEGAMSSPALAEALSRAQAQARMGQTPELSREALEALAESLDLAEMELSQLQQAMNDMQALEEALRTLQLAQQCNQQNPLDGNSCTNGASLSDYAAMYQSMLAEQSACGSCAGCISGIGCQNPGKGGAGQGMGGPGQGRGGNAPEDDSLATDYKSEKSRSAMRAGKMLMQWQTDESADRGQVATDYDNQIQDLRDGVSEAVVNERIPPGYHDTIQHYFDSLTPAGETTPPTTTDSE
jgi:chemotaxis protein histidine kinase CheA